MKWSYKCPHCGVEGNVDWEKRNNSFTCHSCKSTHYPPTPSTQPSAYVDTREWPQEIENIVVNQKGIMCTVPGCGKKANTLDHRIPFAKNGKTSINNLFPMCKEPNQSKSDNDYQTWLNNMTSPLSLWLNRSY
jgi:5-methylcytosine-specific restriction endonuclease McrA